MRIFLHGDHSKWHCGSKAVVDYIKLLIADSEHQLTSYFKSDCVIINGEGSLHHNNIKKLAFGKKALKSGRQVHLINALWQDMSHPIIDCIKDFNTVVVRDWLSFDEIRRIREDVQLSIDLSYFQPVVLPHCSRNERINGGFIYSLTLAEALPEINIKSYSSWQQYLNALAVSKVLFTGYHHAVIAACKLRIPFVAYKGNSDKVLGLIRSAGAAIPVATTPHEFYCLSNNLPDDKEYAKLFDYMANQKKFELADLNWQ